MTSQYGSAVHPELRRHPVTGGCPCIGESCCAAPGRPLAVVPFLDDGTKIVADLRTSLGRGLYRYRVTYCDEDFEILRRFLTPGDTFVDCGANVGQFSLVAARLVGDAGRVIAFEPVPEVRAAPLRNVAVNGLANVAVLDVALGSANGTSAFYATSDGGGLSSFAPRDRASAREIRVDVKRLDDCIPDDVRRPVPLVKLDVEGAELSALHGAMQLLNRDRPAWLVEVEDDHLKRQGTSEAELRSFFSSVQYEAIPTPGPSPNVLFVPREQAHA